MVLGGGRDVNQSLKIVETAQRPFAEIVDQTDALYYKTKELQRKAESHFQHTKVHFCPSLVRV